MIQDKLLKQSPFYTDVLEEGVEGSITTVLAARFGAVPDRLSERVHNIRERGMDLLNELIKLAATVNDIDEFERKLDKMM